ncbi:lysoplasmalogenase [Laceyella sacchari]|jgi:uncharacterized membrane protein YhhN|uniref:Lysoplasmalogenase n=2 Tax=Laceyella sacchari TaxID=37482 RepID=A0ABY5U7Y0_LACSH|nr:lysoplasmalogenase [Laceyella sacchari]UWE05155.1 lysoplasmalogenase [Laceyella sacchari]
MLCALYLAYGEKEEEEKVMPYSWLGVIMLSSLAYLTVLAKGYQTGKYVLKPGTMGLIIAMAVAGLDGGDRAGWLILIGLCCSLIGDICLMLPKERFLEGLGAFFLAHLCYVAAFSTLGDAPLPRGLLAALVCVGVGYMLVLRAGVVREGGTLLLVAVGCYIAVITWMLAMAVQTGSPLLITGAVAFYLSDAVLAWNRFVRPFPWAELVLMALYFLAQALLALAVWGGLQTA